MKRHVATLAALVTLALPATALAATSTPVDDQYANPTEAPTLGESQAPESGTVAGLPFTGQELGLLTTAGLLVLGAGAAVHRIGRSSRRDDARDPAA